MTIDAVVVDARLSTTPQTHDRPRCRRERVIDAERAEPYYPGNDECLVSFLMPYEEFVGRFGPAHRQMEDRDDEPGPCEYWAFRFPCGLSVFLVYHPSRPPSPGCYVCANRPETDHLLHHLQIADRVEWRLDRAHPDAFRERHGEGHPACCPSAAAPVAGGGSAAAGVRARNNGIPDATNLYGTVRTSLTKAELAAVFAAHGWRTRKCSWIDYELRSTFGELILEADDPLLLHGPVADVLANAPRIADVLRAAHASFSLECYAPDRETLLTTIES